MKELDPKWITGFVDGEGCFHVAINKNSKCVTGFQVIPEFTVVQHERDIQILHKIKKYFNCGVIRKNNGNRYCFRVRSVKNIEETIIPFFQKNSLQTVKKIMFQRFVYVLLLIKRKEHLEINGIEKIRKIQSLMNRKLFKK